MTREQTAAAFHGMAVNAVFPLEDRYRHALKALELYEAAVDEYTAELDAHKSQGDTRWAMPAWMRRYATSIQHDGPTADAPRDVIAYVEKKVHEFHHGIHNVGTPGHTEAEAIWKQVQVLQALHDFGSLRE